MARKEKIRHKKDPKPSRTSASYGNGNEHTVSELYRDDMVIRPRKPREPESNDLMLPVFERDPQYPLIVSTLGKAEFGSRLAEKVQGVDIVHRDYVKEGYLRMDPVVALDLFKDNATKSGAQAIAELEIRRLEDGTEISGLLIELQSETPTVERIIERTTVGIQPKTPEILYGKQTRKMNSAVIVETNDGTIIVGDTGGYKTSGKGDRFLFNAQVFNYQGDGTEGIDQAIQYYFSDDLTERNIGGIVPILRVFRNAIEYESPVNRELASRKDKKFSTGVPIEVCLADIYGEDAESIGKNLQDVYRKSFHDSEICIFQTIGGHLIIGTRKKRSKRDRDMEVMNGTVHGLNYLDATPSIYGSGLVRHYGKIGKDIRRAPYTLVRPNLKLEIPAVFLVNRLRRYGWIER